MEETRALDQTDRPKAPALSPRLLKILGWTLVSLSALLIVFHLLWMWRRMGSAAPILAIAIGLEGVVGIGLIFAAKRLRTKS